jgi:hypothetical protein
MTSLGLNMSPRRFNYGGSKGYGLGAMGTELQMSAKIITTLSPIQLVYLHKVV